jgi:hypothetical protein
MKKFLAMTLAALTVFGAVAATSVEAEAGQRKRGGIDPGAAVAIGIIGLAAGAIIAGAGNAHADPYGHDDVGYGGYDGYDSPPYAGHGYSHAGYDRPYRKNKRCWTQEGYDRHGNYVERLICEKRYR